MDLLTTLGLATTLAGIITLYFVQQHYNNKSYFESKGIPYDGNVIFGFFQAMILRKNLYLGLKEDYLRNKGKGRRVVGIKDFTNYSIGVHDPEILKSILVKDFDHFVDRKNLQWAETDVIFQKMLFAVNGEPWKALRSKLSPTFTTGKIKRVTTLLDQSGVNMVSYITQETKLNSEIDLVEIYSKYTLDVIASIVCGYNSQAFNQKEPTVFERMGKRMRFKFGGRKALEMIVLLTAPKLAKHLGFAILDKNVTDFFRGAIQSAIREREAGGVKRDDFLQILLEAREGTLTSGEDETLGEFEKAAQLKGVTKEQVLDDDTIIANCTLFFLAGLDTVQSALLFCAYALALNQDVQDKLRREIDEVLENSGGELTYDGIHSMGYLDMVVQETLRFYPPAPITDRGCTQDYKIPGTEFILKKGDGIFIPVYGYHHDPEYFPEPEKFDPERFSPKNKPNINPYVYLPFGQGPRNCIGMRFALAEVKVAIIHLVHNFKIEPSTKTLIPMKYATTTSLKPEGGMFLSLTKIM